MRIIAEIPHESCKISVFYMNQKYIIKFEKGNFEQCYKISEIDYAIKDLEDIKKIVLNDLINKAIPRFAEMQNDLSVALKDY